MEVEIGGGTTLTPPDASTPFVGREYALVVYELVPELISDGGTDWGALKKELSSKVSRKSL